jgi:hypothetical protein
MDPTTFASLAQLGAAGAVIIVVLIFLNYIAKRDAEWREFFTVLNSENKADMTKVTAALDRLVNSVDCVSDKIDKHEGKVDERIRIVQAQNAITKRRPGGTP